MGRVGVRARVRSRKRAHGGRARPLAQKTRALTMEERPRSFPPVERLHARVATAFVVCALSSAFACGGRAFPTDTIGVTDKSAVRKEPSDAGSPLSAPDAGSPSVLPADYRTTFTKLNDTRFVSRGHAPGRWDVDLYANELAVRAIASRSKRVPPGAIVIEEHFERAGQERAQGPIYMMEKVGAETIQAETDASVEPEGDAPSSFRFVIVGSQGQRVRDGRIESCSGCHDDSPMDGFFPLVP
jgi:hypothetical protein